MVNIFKKGVFNLFFKFYSTKNSKYPKAKISSILVFSSPSPFPPNKVIYWYSISVSLRKGFFSIFSSCFFFPSVRWRMTSWSPMKSKEEFLLTSIRTEYHLECSYFWDFCPICTINYSWCSPVILNFPACLFLLVQKFFLPIWFLSNGFQILGERWDSGILYHSMMAPAKR